MFLGFEATWEREYVTGWTVLTDTLDTDAMVATARRLHETDPFDGVLCWDESRIVQATRVAAELGLPGVADEVTARVRDKHLTRQALAAGGVPQPGSVRVDTLTEALAAADRFGYPVILKPSDLALSMGVVRVDDAEQLTRFFDFTRGQLVDELPGYRVRVLVEEYAPGEEISVDVAVHRGEVFPLCGARKQIGFPPYCIETGHLVDADDPLRDDPVLLDVLRGAHAALGFTDGVTHTEL
ncbi:MAG TPA: ATP-grasp domain-containing protein, partial [Micromonospora sp.]